MMVNEPDPLRRRRIVVAFLASVALNALVIGAGLLHSLPVRDDQEPSTRVVLEVRPRPVPTPPPRSTPPPPTPAPRPFVVLVPQPVHRRVVATAPVATPQRSIGGNPQPNELVRLTASAPPNGSAAAAGSGVAGNGTGASSGAGDAGAGGSGAAQPCGAVSFIPTGTPNYTNGKWYETIRAMVEFPDGHTESGVFPYPWVYANQNDDPWAPQNLNKRMTAHAQLPPAGSDVADADRVVQLVLQYTRPNGTTVLPLCPGQSDNR